MLLVLGLTALAAALSLATIDVAGACTVCSRGDPLAPAADGHGEGGDLRVALDGEALSQRSGTPGVSSMEDVLDQYTLKLTGVYSPFPSLNLVASVPFTRKKMRMEHGAAASVPVAAPTDRTGIGDVDVGARWFFWESLNVRARMRQGLAITAGTSLPTGPSDPRFLLGQPNAQHAQIGSGAFGPYAGLSYRLQRDPYAALLSVSGRVHDANDQGYRYGGAFLWTAQGQWSPAEWIALGLGLDGHDGGRDRLDGVPVQNTGGAVVWASPSAFLNVYRRTWLTLKAQVPVHSRLVGDQSVGSVFTAGIQYAVF